MQTKPDCNLCRKLYETKGETPNCRECIEPLMPENWDVMRIYAICKNQLILSPGGNPVDVHISAIDTAMRRLGLEGVELFERTVNICRHYIGWLREGSKK